MSFSSQRYNLIAKLFSIYCFCCPDSVVPLVPHCQYHHHHRGPDVVRGEELLRQLAPRGHGAAHG